jgi:hypothetical protein
MLADYAVSMKVYGAARKGQRATAAVKALMGSPALVLAQHRGQRQSTARCAEIRRYGVAGCGDRERDIESNVLNVGHSLRQIGEHNDGIG